jgi:hypothetical protein
MTNQGDIHDEFAPVVDRLRVNRPTATALELDAVKQRVLARPTAPSNGRRLDFMRSRAAILATLVLGLTLSSTGAGLAISGFTDDQASVAQYPTNTPPSNTVLPPSDTSPPGGGVEGETDEQPSGGVLGGSDETGAQPSRQVTFAAESGDETSLPFTGFAAIPILLLGVALLGTGIVLRRGPER